MVFRIGVKREKNKNEGRKYPRSLLTLPIEYYANNPEIPRLGHTYNLSSGGVMLNLPEQLRIGQLISLAIFFSFGPSLDTIKVNSQVVWVDENQRDGNYRYGVKFVDLTTMDRSKLEKILS